MSENRIRRVKSIVEDEFSNYEEIAGGSEYRHHHSVAVLENVRKLAEKIDVDTEIDQDLIEVAALVHDIGRAEDIEDGVMDPFDNHETHAERGVRKLPEMLGEMFSDSEIEDIQRLVENHHDDFEDEAGKLLQDADSLCHVGVNDLWRAFNYSFHRDRDIIETADYILKELIPIRKDELEDFYFQETREVARKRIQEQREAAETILKEMRGEDI